MALPRNIPEKTGELLAARGLIHPDDINRALAIQEKARTAPAAAKHRLLGAILCDLNLVTPLDNFLVLHENQKLTDLDRVLADRRMLSPDQARAARERAFRTGIPYISLLMAEGLVPREVLQTLLFDLFRIPLRSVGELTYPENRRADLARIVPGAAAERHQTVPLVLKQNTLLCGITAPDALLFFRDLDRNFPQYRFKPMFISFSGFNQCYGMLYGKGADRAEKTGDGPVDLSLLLTYKIEISDPKKETSEVLSLFKRYEQIRELMAGSPVSDEGEIVNSRDRRAGFITFIREQHLAISQKYNSPAIEYSLELHGRRLVVLAAPRHDSPLSDPDRRD